MIDPSGFLYAADMTNRLALHIPEDQWDIKLIEELGTLRKLFVHMIRVRDIYRDGLRTGVIKFPGESPRRNMTIIDELARSRDDLAHAFRHSKINTVQMGSEQLSGEELLGIAIQHEGIHQGQYFVALKHYGLKRPHTWIQEWDL